MFENISIDGAQTLLTIFWLLLAAIVIAGAATLRTRK
jgi:hypothetical protein